MDSRVQTSEHIRQVQAEMAKVIKELIDRSMRHDHTKLVTPEVELFDEFTPLLAGTTYGTDAYRELLAKIKPALDHHYAAHRHHPEHFENGIDGMSLVDLLEMICDWVAAARRHADGDVLKSIEINQKRFGYSDSLKQIFLNTLEDLR